MMRAITDFRLDADGHWVAELDCGHGQHTRDDPPFVERAWVRTEAGRGAKIGSLLDCLRCDRRELPEGYVEYKRTPLFTSATIPRGLRSRHSTKSGVWARIELTARSGSLRYRIHEPYDEEQLLGADEAGIVLPEVEHEVAPVGEVEFSVVFLRRPRESGDG
jgi:tellurite resistance-related uncharacterized protein